MTKKLNYIMIAVFLASLFFSMLISFSKAYTFVHAEIYEFLFYILGFSAIVTFPFSVVSFMFSMSWKVISRDAVYRNIVRDSPIYFLIWRELRNESEAAEHQDSKR